MLLLKYVLRHVDHAPERRVADRLEALLHVGDDGGQQVYGLLELGGYRPRLACGGAAVVGEPFHHVVLATKICVHRIPLPPRPQLLHAALDPPHQVSLPLVKGLPDFLLTLQGGQRLRPPLLQLLEIHDATLKLPVTQSAAHDGRHRGNEAPHHVGRKIILEKGGDLLHRQLNGFKDHLGRFPDGGLLPFERRYLLRVAG
mmetsp:Transcript_97035/g.274200  ORF Transcript_97035/g.274200 Transcript_97035/m.274200 type:complete len:200 (+) Transcript_97035:1061-1660(+)